MFKEIVLIMFVGKEWRMKIQTEQNKPHRNQTSTALEFTVSFTLNPMYNRLQIGII